MNEKLVRKAESLQKNCPVCTVASVTENGYPRICVLAPLKTVGIKEFWFSTGTSSHKVRHYLQNNKAGVTFYSGGDSVTLTGTMEIISDRAEKDALWQDWLGAHFTNGGKSDPEYGVIHFTAAETTIYIENEFETFQI